MVLDGDDTPSHLTEADEIPHRNTFRDQIVEQPMHASNKWVLLNVSFDWLYKTD